MAEEKIGRYEVIKELGRGGMGVVYLARDPLINREVALKMVQVEGFTDEQAREIKERFHREAMAAGRLNHPNIVTVYDVGEHEGNTFIAMEYVPGRSLEDVLCEDALMSLPRIAEIIEGIAGALDHAHSKGIVHRDIKPANILLPAQGGVRVTDFGIARIEDMRMTREGAMLGSPSYMSPEQILGREIDHRSDIFSLGVILYIMLTGEKPFPGESLATLTYRIVQENPTPPSQLVQGLDPRFDAIIAKALAKSADKRYSSAGELARDVRAVVETTGGETLVAKALSSSGTVVTEPSNKTVQSYPSITAIPVSDSTIRSVAEAKEEAIVPRTLPRRLTFPALVVLALILAIAVMWKVFGARPATKQSTRVPAPTSGQLQKEYSPVGIVPRAYILWRDANYAVEEKNWSKAQALLKELELISPADAEAQMLLGRVTKQLQGDSGAIDRYARALQLSPDLKKDAQLLADLIEILGSRNSRAVKEAMSIIVEQMSDIAEKPLIEAVASGNKVQARNALLTLVAIWNKRLDKNPNDADTLLKLARAYYQLNEHEKAMTNYSKLLSVRASEKNNPELIVNLVEMLNSNKPELAKDILVRQVGPPAIPSLEQITTQRGAKLYNNARETLKAILTEQVKNEPRNASPALKLAFLLFEMKLYENAFEALSEAIKRDSSLSADPKVLEMVYQTLEWENAGKALEVIAYQIGEKAIPRLNKAIESDNHFARWNGVKVLQMMGKAQNLDITALLIRDLLDKNSTCAIRLKAVEELAKGSDSRVPQAIASAMEDPVARKCGKKAYKQALEKLSPPTSQ